MSASRFPVRSAVYASALQMFDECEHCLPPPRSERHDGPASLIGFGRRRCRNGGDLLRAPGSATGPGWIAQAHREHSPHQQIRPVDEAFRQVASERSACLSLAMGH